MLTESGDHDSNITDETKAFSGTNANMSYNEYYRYQQYLC